jgi:hypothetical protein
VSKRTEAGQNRSPMVPCAMPRSGDPTSNRPTKRQSILDRRQRRVVSPAIPSRVVRATAMVRD